MTTCNSINWTCRGWHCVKKNSLLICNVGKIETQGKWRRLIWARIFGIKHRTYSQNNLFKKDDSQLLDKYVHGFYVQDRVFHVPVKNETDTLKRYQCHIWREHFNILRAWTKPAKMRTKPRVFSHLLSMFLFKANWARHDTSVLSSRSVFSIVYWDGACCERQKFEIYWFCTVLNKSDSDMNGFHPQANIFHPTM